MCGQTMPDRIITPSDKREVLKKVTIGNLSISEGGVVNGYIPVDIREDINYEKLMEESDKVEGKATIVFKKEKEPPYGDRDIPQYVSGAMFIDEHAEVDEAWWPRDPKMYYDTRNWQERREKLEGVITDRDIEGAIKKGEMYKAARDNIAFVEDLGGVVLYVIVGAEIIETDDEFPDNPTKSDFEFIAISLWPYIYNSDQARNDGRWTQQDLDKIEQIKEENQEHGHER